MVEGAIPQNAVWLSVAVLTYSTLCLTVSFLLLCTLWVQRERSNYVSLVAGFVTLGTVGSIAEQIHYAFDWADVKQAQFEKALLSMSMPSLAISNAAQVVDVWLFHIQFYTYNVNSLLILFWAVSLYKSAWDLKINWLFGREHLLGLASKLFALVLPLILIGLSSTDTFMRHTILHFVTTNVILIVTPATGSILQVLILYKYIKTRRMATTRQDSNHYRPDAKQMVKSPSVSGRIGDGVTKNASTSNRGLIVRFSIGFVVLAAFEVTVLIYEVVQIRRSSVVAAQPNVDHSLAGTVSDLLLFIPGVTVSLTTFLVFGTSRKSLQIYRKMLSCGYWSRKASADADIEDTKQPNTILPNSKHDAEPQSYFNFDFEDEVDSKNSSWSRPQEETYRKHEEAGILVTTYIEQIRSLPIESFDLNKPLPETPGLTSPDAWRRILVHSQADTPRGTLREVVEIGFIAETRSEWMAAMRESGMTYQSKFQ